MLKGVTVTTIEVDYEDVDIAINEYYGIDNYEFVAHEECSNDSSHQYKIDGTLCEYDMKTINSLLKDGKISHYSTSKYLNYMCADGAIEPGIYTIKVSW